MANTRPAQPAVRILVAEDDAVTRRLVTFKLQREGYAVEAAANGEELLAKAAVQPPALVILDIMMPIQDGFSALRRLKEDPQTAGAPVIMLSGKSDEQDVVRCLNAGAADYMVKPFSPDELVVRVRKLLKK
ncbi:MAG TPA: response regulator transcription factor [Opitutaceae bacterium]|nr:response regulator transcription factor [Opitutaceae bacterium]